MRVVRDVNLLILFFTLSLGAEVVVENSTEVVESPTPSPIVEIAVEEGVDDKSTPKTEKIPVTKESQPKVEEPNIKELVSQVQDAPDDQKRVLMNQLKMRLKKMNKESRKKVMKQLKSSFATKDIEHKEHQKQHNREAQHGNHQPKFRHLQRGSGESHRGSSGGSGGGNNTPHQGSGHK